MTKQQLNAMLESGELMPPTQSQAYVRKQALFLVGCLATTIAPVIFVAITLAVMTSAVRRSGGFDSIIEIEVGLLVLAASLGPSLCMIAFTGNCRDQIKIAKDLERQIKQCSESNLARWRFVSTSLKFQSSSHVVLANSICALMDANLLQVLIRYKIFSARYVPLKHLFRWIAQFACLLLFLLPLSSAIHLPYLNKSHVSLFRFGYFIITYFTTQSSMFMLLILCTSNIRCLRVYKSLWSLQANITYIQDQAANNSVETKFVVGVNTIFDEHTVNCLQRELFSSEMVNKRLTTSLFGTQVNYSFLLKMLFWFGILVQPMIISVRRDELQQRGAVEKANLFARLFNDPLGLLDYRVSTKCLSRASKNVLSAHDTPF